MKNSVRRPPKFQYNLSISVNAIIAQRNHRAQAHTMTLARNISQQTSHFKPIAYDKDDTDDTHAVHTPISSHYQASVFVKTTCSSPLPLLEHTPKRPPMHAALCDKSDNVCSKRNQTIAQSYTTMRPSKNYSVINSNNNSYTADKPKNLNYLLDQLVNQSDSPVIADDEEESNRLRNEKRQIKSGIEKLSILLRDRIRRNTKLRLELNYILGLK
jgi:hypothetical protein